MADWNIKDSQGDLMGGASDLFSGMAAGQFDFGGNYGAGDAEAFGQSKGSKVGSGIGTGVGLALAPLTGGLSIPIGKLLGGAVGGMIGGNAAGNKAAPILANREAKKTNMVSMYQDLARGSAINEQQRAGMNFIDEQYRTNLPSL